MMKLLQGFNESWWRNYDQEHNTASADTFRATLMVSAMSYGFGKDLRAEFRNLNFPINDGIYLNIYNSVPTAIESRLIAPSLPELAQNYPNPFNPSTIVRYQLPNAATITLKVYNPLGQEVATLVSEFQAAGTYNVRWSPQLPGGAYIYRLQAGGYVQSRKLILLR
jgi:hypothetical protein